MPHELASASLSLSVSKACLPSSVICPGIITTLTIKCKQPDHRKGSEQSHLQEAESTHVHTNALGRGKANSHIRANQEPKETSTIPGETRTCLDCAACLKVMLL